MTDKVTSFPSRGFADSRDGIATLLEQAAARIRSGETDAGLCVLITDLADYDSLPVVEVFGGNVTNAYVVGLIEYAKYNYMHEKNGAP